MTISGDGTWSIGDNWPWPIVFFGSYYTIGIGQDDTNLKLYELYCDTSDLWTASEIVTLGAAANISFVDFADFHKFYAISVFGESGGTVSVDGVIRNPGDSAPLTTALPTSNVPAFGTCCNFNGQGIIGCIAHGDESNFGDMGYNSVAWSRIGYYNFRINNTDEDRVFDQTAGYMSLDWGEYGTGVLHKVMKLGNSVLAIGEGMARLVPVTEPAVTFGKQPLPYPGITSGNHIAGTDKVACYMDENSELWMVSAGFEFTKLGYKEFLEDLTRADVRVTYCPGREAFFISDGSTGYCLTAQGLYSTNQLVSAVGTFRGTDCGFFLDSEDYEARVETGILDFAQRGMKTIGVIEVGADYYDGNDTALQASIKYRYDHKDQAFSQTSWKVLNKEGILTMPVTAPEVKLAIKAEDYRNASLNLDYAKVRVKLSDKRSMRGTHNVSNVSS